MTLSVLAQNNNTPTPPTGKPKLVVGIVVDQMRWDYLYRYEQKYGQTGFKRLQKGYNCENTHIPYVPTYTGPGHTCIYTGSVPAIHGIVGNDWYDRETRSIVTCVGDPAYITAGSASKVGKASPNRLLTTTVTDELRMATNFRTKVISIAAKDRSAILPGGHAANAAYFFDGEAGDWVSSTYYMDTLPTWVKGFNTKKLAVKYIRDNWHTLLDKKLYTESAPDDESYERKFGGEDKPIFPHLDSTKVVKDPGVILSTPWGNTLTFDFAKAAIDGEKLGKGNATDFLALSFSSTDYIGHQFGPNSVEAEDCYIRFDRDLGDFLSYLDQHVGAGNYVIFLTADHGAAQADGFNKEHHVPSGNVPDEQLTKAVNAEFKSKWGVDSMVLAFDNMQFYIKDHYGADQHTDMAAAVKIIETVLSKEIKDQIKMVIDLHDIKGESIPIAVRETIINGYNTKRSGDIQLAYEPAVLENRPLGTTHGSFYNYDTHIPLLWYGWGIHPGHDYSPTYMTDIAATLAALLHIQEPNGSIGRPIEGILKK